jgi:transcriptional regulator with XRE-family HTH domain
VKSKTLASLLRRLCELRKANGLTQEAFAELAGMGYKYYQAVEAGRKKELRVSTLEKLAAAYGIELWELLAPQAPQVRLTAAPRRKRPPKR